MNVGTLFTPTGYHRSWRAQIAAKYKGVKLDVANFIPGETDKDPAFLKKFPPNTVPVFQGRDGTNLFDVNAISYFLGSEQLRGGENEHYVTQWINFTDNNLLPSIATWVYPCLGVTQFDKQATEKAKANLSETLKYMNETLRTITFLVGERVTQADITVFTALHPLFTTVYDESKRRAFPHVLRWYLTIANQPLVAEVVGKVQLCEKEAQYDPKKYSSLHQKGKSESDKKKQEKKPKAEKPVKEKPEVSKDDEDEEKPRPSKNPFANLPDGNFDMDCFKRLYSNEDIESVALPYFWEHFNPETHSIWFCEYNYPEELGLIFMTCNLVGGMFQRLEKMLKYAFGSMCIFGKDRQNSISGLWFWRGTGLAFDLDEDLQIDYESYTWRKLDPAGEETKQLVHDYFMQEFKDKLFNQGKIFK